MPADDAEKPQRHPLRLPSYDYSHAGAYFVTICTQGSACMLGDVSAGSVDLSEEGKLINAAWQSLPARFPAIELDAMVIMPNHIHGIIIIQSANKPLSKRTSAMNCAPTDDMLPITLGEVIRVFKAVSCRWVRKEINPEFSWQRNYYEHIIRDENELNSIRQYITRNPLQWAVDEGNLLIPEVKTELPWR
jgi:putative transposase